MDEIKLDMRRMGGRDQAHAYLRRKLKAQGYRGNNLDALYDLATSLPNARIILRYSDNRQPGSYQAKVLKALGAAAGANPGLQLERR